MSWGSYWGIVRRRWMLIVAVLVLDVLAAGFVYSRSSRHVGYQACSTLYVADASSPSLVAAASSSVQTAELLAGETAANFFADDILDVAQSKQVARYVSATLRSRNLPSTAEGDVEGAVSGARRDRTVDLCVANPEAASALAVAQVVDRAMTTSRARFVGKQMAHRTFVSTISAASVAPASSSSLKRDLSLRLVLGFLVAIGLALAWDALDPTVRDERDIEQAMGAPVFVVIR